MYILLLIKFLFTSCKTKVLKMLNHPNIICYYDSFEEDGVLMIEMEYADDGTLAQYLAKQVTKYTV